MISFKQFQENTADTVSEAIYKNQVGFMEVMKYDQIADPREKARFHAHLAAGRKKTALGMIERKLKVKFQ